MSKLKRIDLINYFILLLPFIDFITSICTWNQLDFSIGLIIKGLFLLYACFYLLKNTSHKKIFIFLGIYFVVYIAYLLTNHMHIVAESINIIKIFYLPILILFFAHYQNEHITKKTLTIVLLFYLILYLFPAFLGLGHNISEIYPNKELYLSYFYVGNELANVFILLIPIAIIYLQESNSYLLKGVFVLLILLAILFMSTKTFYLSLIIMLLYFIISKRKEVMHFIKENYLKTLILVVVVLLGIVVYIPKMDLTENIKVSLEHYEVDSVRDLFTFENIDNVIYSSRLTYLKNMQEAYQEGEALEKLLGLGRVKVDSIKNVEIDIFDIFYSIGIIGFLFYILFFIYVLKNSKLKNTYKFTFILLLVISCFTGHVLISPFTSTFLSLLFLVSKNDKGRIQKDVLLVTNMYPSATYPHYGIFVKNTYELLVENNYNVDLVVIHKTDNKYKKLLCYLKFYMLSFIKTIWNNYDYIYVHFISHSTRGVIIPYRFSKNTKLILNVHGNDVVADSSFEIKNEKNSARYLPYADTVISPSKYFETILMTKYNIPKNKIVVYPSGGVDINKFKKINKKKAIKNAGLKENAKYFGYIARIEKDKGYDTLLLAIHELSKKKKLKDINFLIVGSGAEENKLEELIQKYKLKKYIERRPLVSQEELESIYNAIEALIYPTRRKSESLGLTGLEAMSCETLVIGSNKFGPSDYLMNNVNSLTFDPENYQELALKIEEVLNMKVKDKNKLTKEARKKSEEYSFENTKDVLLKVFQK